MMVKRMLMSAHASTSSGMGMARVALFLLFSISILLPIVVAQPGYISIDCGSTVNYTDPTTGVAWVTDEGYISNPNLGINQAVTVLLQADNYQQITTARYFKLGRRKNCYVLPVAHNNSYMIRATFLYGDIDGGTPPTNYGFNLSIDSTIVLGVGIAPSAINTVVEHEFFVASTGNTINFCVIPVVGYAFISALELRPLMPTMYRGVMFGYKYTKTLIRLNCGAAATDPTVRFPDDIYDRLWKSPTADYQINTISTTATLGPVPASIFDNPPVKVLQDAWSDYDFWFNTPFPQETTTIFYATLYFLEIGSPNPTDRRSLDIYLNDAVWFSYNVSKTVNEIYSPDDPITTGSANFSLFRAQGSTLDPLLNAFELHAVYDTVTTTTLSTDATALLDVQQDLNLLDWTGDPCLPVPWDWLNCTNTAPPRVTQVKLSGYGLNGTIPASLANLTALTDLWLDNNFLTGPIPDLSGLTLLKTLHLQNNSLTGPIPASLANIPNLSELFLENNKFNSTVPAALLNKNGLIIVADSFSNSRSSSSSKKSSSIGAIIGGIAGGAVVLLVFAILAFCLCVRRNRKAKTEPQPEITGIQTGASKFSVRTHPLSKGLAAGQASHHVQSTQGFSKTEVVKATDNFSNKIGEGGFGPVYYGRLATGEEVAVKVNSAESGQGSVEFSTEVSLLSRVHHRNLVSLVGYCDDHDQQILIYDYMQNGTLREHLYGRGLTKTLDWRTRLDIAVNAARGLEYLHYDCSPKIIHRDVKSNNILLNEKLLAKVADFGISKLAPDEDTNAGVSTVVRGTTGYLDPEYFFTNKLTQKSDVYAFGVVLLEIIAGRAPNNNRLDDPLQWNLSEYARGMLRDGNVEGIVDPSIRGTYNMEAMWKLAELAMYCVEPHSVNRPDMRQVVRELMEAVDLEHPTDSAPSMVTSNVTMGFTNILKGNTQTSYQSTQSSKPNASPGTDIDSSSFTPEIMQQPQAR
ncbi:unnamed protein product [Calypogeia fissa]